MATIPSLRLKPTARSRPDHLRLWSNASTYTIRVQPRTSTTLPSRGMLTDGLTNLEWTDSPMSGTPVVGQTLRPPIPSPIRTAWARSPTNGTATVNRSLRRNLEGILDGLDYARTMRWRTCVCRRCRRQFGELVRSRHEHRSVNLRRGMLKDGLGGVDGLNKAYVVTLSSDDKNAFVTSNFQNSLSWFERNETTFGLRRNIEGWCWGCRWVASY